MCIHIYIYIYIYICTYISPTSMAVQDLRDELAVDAALSGPPVRPTSARTLWHSCSV